MTYVPGSPKQITTINNNKRTAILPLASDLNG